MKKEKVEGTGKNKKPIPKKTEVGNGQDIVQGWGMVHCADCELPVAFYPPDVEINDADNIELYCQTCAMALNQVEQ